LRLTPARVALGAVFLLAFIAICVGSPTLQATGFALAVVVLIVLGGRAFGGRERERPPEA
jgi:membrane protein implicated in regulation of membrane protease activity